jgi:tungstate transport system ATP-binding protein
MRPSCSFRDGARTREAVTEQKWLFRVTDVSVRRGGRTILEVPCLELPAGQVTVLVGPSGAGKSTLLRLLAGLEVPDTGRVEACGPDGRQLAPGSVTMCFQRPILLRRTVRQNVAYALGRRPHPKRLADVNDLLARLRLSDAAHRAARTLSGGEHQRVALARALLVEPEALLLDEPTANLDPENVALIEALVAERQRDRGMSVVWVTHHLFQARRVGAFGVVLIGGHVREAGPAEELFSAPRDPQAAAFLRGEMIW